MAVRLTSGSDPLRSELLRGVRLLPEPSASIQMLVDATWHRFLDALGRLVCLSSNPLAV